MCKYYTTIFVFLQYNLDYLFDNFLQKVSNDKKWDVSGDTPISKLNLFYFLSDLQYMIAY